MQFVDTASPDCNILATAILQHVKQLSAIQHSPAAVAFTVKVYGFTMSSNKSAKAKKATGNAFTVQFSRVYMPEKSEAWSKALIHWPCRFRPRSFIYVCMFKHVLLLVLIQRLACRQTCQHSDHHFRQCHLQTTPLPLPPPHGVRMHKDSSADLGNLIPLRFNRGPAHVTLSLAATTSRFHL